MSRKSIEEVESPLKQIEVVTDPQASGSKIRQVNIKAHEFTDSYKWQTYAVNSKDILGMLSILTNRIARDVLSFYDIKYVFKNGSKDTSFIAKKGQTIPLEVKQLVQFSESLKKVIINSLTGSDTNYGIVNYKDTHVLVAKPIEGKNNEYYVKIDDERYPSVVNTLVLSSFSEYIKDEITELYNIRQYARFALKTMTKLGSKPITFIKGLTQMMSAYGSNMQAKDDAMNFIKKQINSIYNSQLGYMDSESDIRLLDVIRLDFLKAVQTYINQELCKLFGFSISYFNGEMPSGINGNAAGVSDQEKNNKVLSSIGEDVLEGFLSDLKIYFTKKSTTSYSDSKTQAEIMQMCERMATFTGDDLLAMKQAYFGNIVGNKPKK